MMTIDRLVSPISWKIEEHNDLLSAGLTHNLFLDFLSRAYRKKAFNQWTEYPIRFAEESGCNFTPDTPGRTLKEIFVDKVYSIDGFTPEKGDVVLDVGANYGDSAIWWAKTFGAKVIAFEPLKNVYSILCKNIEMNHIENIMAYNIALGKGNKLEGYSNGDMFIAGKKGQQKLIDSMPLDNFPVETVNILKIDVEGFEADVLEGGIKTLKKHRPKVIMEVHSYLLKQKCHSILTELGYRLSLSGRIVKSGAPGMDLVQNLFYSPTS